VDHHGPFGRLPLRIGRRRLLAAVAAFLLIGCSGNGSVVNFTTTAPTPVPPATTATTTSSTTSTTTTSTTTTSSTTTTTTLPLEAWQVDDRRYYFPIQPPGVASYSRSHHDYPATDIFAPAGSVLVAVTGGVIDELRHDDPWDPAVDDGGNRGGRFISLVGDDGVRYYCSHLGSVGEGLQAGNRVLAGQALGTIATSGSAASTSPHCHFGISRPTGAGDWEIRRGEVWPYQYLQAWAAGENVTPVLPEG